MDDVGSFEEFLEEALPGLLRYATVLTGSADAAADVVQEVMLRVCSRWRRISAAAVPVAYVHRMITNEWLAHHRRWFTRRVTVVQDLDFVAPARPGFEDLVVARAELQVRLRELSARQRAVVVLRYFLGYNDTEISEELGCAIGTVRSLHSRALVALRTPAPPEGPPTAPQLERSGSTSGLPAPARPAARN